MTAKPIGVGSLFQEDAHSVFMKITLRMYNHMDERLEKKKLPPLPFTLAAFRSHVLSALGGTEDGVTKCRYCNAYFTLGDLACDHALPLSKQGSAGLDNLEFPCRPCNNRKGSIIPGDFLKLLAFLETIPLSRIDILKRLEQSVALAAGARSNAAVIGELRKSGQWQAVQKERRDRKKAKDGGLGKF